MTALDDSVLPIQGPPGAGKTYTGAHMITSLVRAGKKVGITALSHKVIRNLLDKVVAVAESERTTVRCLQKVDERSDEPHPAIGEVKDNEAPLAGLQSDEVHVVAGTAWLWARPEYVEAVDVLFIDEAGQLSLADVLAVGHSARNIVLLGDPQQLRQPLQGSHPEGTDASVLEHLLDGRDNHRPGPGPFSARRIASIPKSAPSRQSFFDDSRLRPIPNLDRQVLDGPTPFAGAGLWFVPVRHEGNQTSAPEEVERVVQVVDGLLAGGVHWTNRENDRAPLQLVDILDHRALQRSGRRPRARLPAGARIGTVDKFQGQDAPVVIGSLTTSSPADAPRGMKFLDSLNRLNVAVSSAKTACILVGSPLLFEPECRTPGQMRLANAFCRYLEMAQRI